MKRNVLIILLFLVIPCAAEQNPAPILALKVQSFLNGIKSLVAEFVQTNSDKSQVSGKIWLKRDAKANGKMRLDYECEVGQTLIANKDELVVYDLNDNSESRYNLDYTPAAFILKPKIDLKRDVTVEKVVQTAEFIEVVMTPKGDATGQSLTLYFSIYANGNVKGLQQWVVKDPQGNETLVQFVPETISLNDPGHIPDSLFDVSPLKT
ncbi:LolA family protein [Candidatus Finniella inopinata]|uniref:Outer membrane lipoprotein carrier protein LolA n=1 Tax=Candidatus Finniella inopinata TaxID=1696036 RepID=A0A4Q7DHC9_9PROT|nr:outer membrane lipoprotein carrier protein LolA [Candidatus Finniella inopinata]RZI46163.1 outer membrane lipoprotein carrier protein LolA [Candidatus Finniella inopinata]